MHNHPYVRAYLAGIAVPTPLLLVWLAIFLMARVVYNVPVPVERIIVFPMAIVPNLFGVWNMLHLASRRRTRLPLGIHGAILPALIATSGFFLGHHLGFLKVTGHSFIYFDVVEIHYAYVALVLAAILIVYYLVWKYIIGFLNRVVGIAE